MMKGLVFWTLVLLLKQISAQDEEEVPAECEENCVDGYCGSICHYLNEPDYILCACEKYVIGGDLVKCDLLCDNSIVSHPETLTEETCKQFCEDNEEGCQAYSFYKDLGVIHCNLLKKCVQDVPDQNPPDIVNAQQRCVACDLLKFEYGLTAIHYVCDFGDTNPYVSTMPIGTQCRPTYNCANPEISMTSDTITCNMDSENPEGSAQVAMWMKGEEVLADLSQDKQCNCDTLKIAEQSGTRVSCEDPVEPVGGFYTLDKPNICILLCDNSFIMKMSCRFVKEENGETKTAWMGEWHDGYEHKLPECLECFSPGGCTADIITTTTTPTPPP